MKLSDRVIEAKTTKEIIDGIVKNSLKFSNFDNSTIFKGENGVLRCVSNNEGDTIYEVKTTRKKRFEGARMVGDGNRANKDANKEEFLSQLFTVVSCIYKDVEFHKGEILIHDDNNDYVIGMTKKIGLEW